MTVSQEMGVEHTAEHVPYFKQETGVLEAAVANFQDKMLWGIDLEREGMELQIDCMNRIEEITVVLGSRGRADE